MGRAEIGVTYKNLRRIEPEEKKKLYLKKEVKCRHSKRMTKWQSVVLQGKYR